MEKRSTNNKKALYARALQEFGIVGQCMKLLEEMSELQTVLLHCLDGRGGIEHLCEEIADVEIMIEQMHIIFSGRLIEEKKAEKLARLQRTLDKS